MTEVHEDRIAGLVRSRLAAALKQAEKAAPGIPVTRATDMPLSPTQERLWFLAQLEPDTPAYNVPLALRLRGPVDLAALTGAVADLAERHWILRGVIEDGRVRPVPAVPVPVVDVDPADLERELTGHAWRPFRLNAEPPMRATVFRLADDECVLALTLHHIATDAWSERVLLDDLARLYAARLGLEPAPDAPALQYADVAAWEAGRQDTDLDWWAGYLAGLPPVLDLPLARPRPPVPGWKGAAVPLEVPEPLAAKVRAVPGTSPFMVFLAGLQALLSRLSGMDDIAVGVPHAGRHHPDAERVVGCFVNTLVVRGDTSGDPTGAELLERARTAALDAYAHAGTPFERVVERLRPERNLAVTPLFQVMLNVYDTGAPITLPGLRVEEVPLEAPTAKFDLNIELGDDGTRFTGELRYRSDLYDETTARRLAGWYLELLDGMLTDPDAPVRMPAGDDLRGPAADLPVDVPLHALVERVADASPDAVAVGTLGYAELDRRANQVAHWLLERGVRPDEPVGVLLERRPELVVAMLGVLKAGAAYLPLDPVYPERRNQAVVADAGARIVLTEAELAAAADASAERPGVDVRPEHLAYVIYTSGSTGRPKGVAVEHRHITHYLGAVAGVLPAGLASFALVSTAAADLGMTNVWCALTTGATLHLIDHETATDPAAFAARLAEQPVDAIKMVPSQLELLGTAALPEKLLILAGEAVPADLVARVRQARPDLEVQIHYGPTETTVSVLACDADESAPGRAPLGRPLADVVCRVADPSGRALPPGVPGELWIGGPSVARGYLGRPDLTAERFTGGWYRTGDRVRVTQDGLIEFLGRVDDQVKVRGFRVELGEVAAALRALPQVAEAYVQPVGAGLERRLAAWVTPATVDAAEVRAALRERLPDYMVPAAIGVLEALPLTPNGKVDRAALPEPEAAPAVRVPLGTPAERLVGEIWTEVLGLTEVWADDDFFALGGHSFAATRVAGRLRERLGAAVQVRLLFEHPVLADLAAALPQPAAAARARRAPVDGPVPLSGVQARLWFLAQLEPDSSAYNVPIALRLRGPLREEALLGAVRDLAERHHVLRSVVDDSGPEPVMVVRDAAEVPVSTERVHRSEVEDVLAAHLATPFALDREPPMRATLLTVDHEEHVLSLTFHHIATDAWTRGLLLDELSGLYAARLGLRPPLGPPPAQYAEVSPVPDPADLDWWAERLDGLPPVLDLPADRPRPAVPGPGGAALDLELPAGLSERIRAVAAAYRSTPFIVLLAGLQALLARLSASADIAVGVPVSGRDHPDTEGVVGCFLNTVVVRTDVGGDPTGRDLLARARESALGALAHAGTPFDRVVDRLRPERNLAATPLFQVMLNYISGVARPELPGLESSEIQLPEQTTKFDLSWHVIDEGPGAPLRGGLAYRTDLFEPGTAEKLARWYTALLDGLLADLDAPVGAVPLEPVTGPVIDGGPPPEPPAGAVHHLIERWVDETPAPSRWWAPIVP
ncbi:amino acid adenylation domain-containing protein [Nonomuraea sp. N2-4H]|uniref:amino acid adenylation domain-containing protein n=1 Tax=Nonomuraea sp. N2-4H TaxID=3128898 RepID=UPI0032540B2B